MTVRLHADWPDLDRRAVAVLAGQTTGSQSAHERVRRWRAGRNTTTAVVEVPVERLAEFRRLVAELGLRVTSPSDRQRVGY